MTLLSRKNLTYGALGIIVLGLALYFLMGRSTAPTDATVTVVDGVGVGPEATFVNLAGELDAISFDRSVFSDPRFTSLKDIHTAIVPETAGRRDPFAPLAGVTVVR